MLATARIAAAAASRASRALWMAWCANPKSHESFGEALKNSPHPCSGAYRSLLSNGQLYGAVSPGHRLFIEDNLPSRFS